MDWLQLIILALVQGLTEFLPISSSAHLILASKVLEWQDQGLAFDIAVHVGTLFAVLLYFRAEVVRMIHAWFGWWAGEKDNAEARLAWAVIVGTIPLGLLGLAFSHFNVVETYLRTTLVIAITTIAFGVLLGVADKFGRGERTEFQMRWRDILIIGGAQALALIPGTSRSGITITAALLLGFSRTAAARYSFLLSIPAIVLPGLLLTVEVVQSQQHLDWGVLVAGAGFSFVSALVCIHVFLKLIERIGMWPFVAYRLLLGAALLTLL